ncbi:MAG: NADH-quinone oxidoreductase subunit J [Candidatus Eisenbacteria bacterium]|nr:NADH-quinone oxidoreductase subunit J [Candidatus Eisenbacteria bacterium]
MWIFFLLALLVVAGALAVVLLPNPIHSALMLVFTLMATAGIFLTLGAQFLAVIQVIVYAGAIMVLFVFVIMLLNLRAGEGGEESLHRKTGLGQILGIGLAALLMLQIGLLVLTGKPSLLKSIHPAAELEAQAGGHSQAIGLLLYGKYLLPFEVASVLLLVAIIGAVALSRRHLVIGPGRDESTEEVP